MTTPSDAPYRLDGKRVFVAGHRGMVGAAVVRRLAAEPCEVLTATRGELDLRRQADVAFRTSPVDGRLPRYQVDKSFNYVDGAFERPGPEMIVYRLRDCR